MTYNNRKNYKNMYSIIPIFLFSLLCGNRYLLLILPGSLIPGLSVYFILSYLLFTPPTITIPLSIILSIMVFGLIRYYYEDYNDSRKKRFTTTYLSDNNHNKSPTKVLVSDQLQGTVSGKGKELPFQNTNNNNVSNIVFVGIYIVLLAIVGVSNASNNPNVELFIPWEQLLAAVNKIIQLGAAIALSFFVPGYALVTMLNRSHVLKGVSRILLAYLFSMLITGLIEYVVSSTVEFAAADISKIIIIVYAVILVLFFVKQKVKILHIDFVYVRSFFSDSKNKVLIFFRISTNSSQFVVFACLFALVLLYTYYLDNSVIVGDQWFHHGRALLFNSGAYKDLAVYESDKFYPPTFSALLTAFYPPFFSAFLAAFFIYQALLQSMHMCQLIFLI